MPLPSFTDLGVSEAVTDTLARRGIRTPFPIQSMVMRDALAGVDVLGKSQTGSGKTLAFAIPIVERTEASGPLPSALVLVPTRELAAQVAEEFADVAKAKGLRVAVAYGGIGIREQGRAIAKAQILIATPGRLEDIAERRLVKLEGVRILVLDEADRMLDMGFQPQVDRIVRRLPKDRQTMFFSATLDGDAGRIAQAYTGDAKRHEVASEAKTVEEVRHRFIPVSIHDKVDALVEILRANRELSLVFVRTKRGADRLVHRLKARSVRADAMHGDMTQPARKRALARFETGKVDVLVATDVAARGLDLKGISHVVNFDPPEDEKGYVHRIGRTARAGRSGVGVTLVTAEQLGDVSRMAARLDLHEEFQEEGLTIAPPRVVFSGSSRGGRSSLHRRTRRRL
ncbi:MAG: DEAD/DEAH box helicase [Actinomycetota bacterium]